MLHQKKEVPAHFVVVPAFSYTNRCTSDGSFCSSNEAFKIVSILMLNSMKSDNRTASQRFV